MARPLSGDLDSFQHIINVQKKTAEIGRLTGADKVAAQELFLLRKGIIESQGIEDPNILRDPSLDAAVFGLEFLFEGIDSEDSLEGIIRLVPDLKKLLVY